MARGTRTDRAAGAAGAPEIAGGPLHHASERQTAEEAGISRTTLRAVYDTVLKPQGWLRRLRVGHGREGSTWYLDDGSAPQPRRPVVSFPDHSVPPDPALEEWTTRDGHNGRHRLHRPRPTDGPRRLRPPRPRQRRPHAHQRPPQRPHQTVAELVGTSSVSRATAYRTLKRLTHHGLVHHTGETWALAPRALEGFGDDLPNADTGLAAALVQGWDEVAERHGTAGVAARRKALHAAERAVYREALDRLAEHRTKAVVIVRDGRRVLVPAPRPDEIPPTWHAPDGRVLDPATGRPAADWRVATDGRLILITPADQRSYDEPAAAHAEALSEWNSAA